MSVTYHVIPSHGTWRVKRSGANRATTVHPTQRAAVDKAYKLAKKDLSGGAVVIHRFDGTVKRSTAFGKNPYRTREHSRVKK